MVSLLQTKSPKIGLQHVNALSGARRKADRGTYCNRSGWSEKSNLRAERIGNDSQGEASPDRRIGRLLQDATIISGGDGEFLRSILDRRFGARGRPRCCRDALGLHARVHRGEPGQEERRHRRAWSFTGIGCARSSSVGPRSIAPLSISQGCVHNATSPRSAANATLLPASRILSRESAKLARIMFAMLRDQKSYVERST